MDSFSRRAPWTLALFGGLHGWLAGSSATAGEKFGGRFESEALPWMLALVLSAAFFLGGHLYFRKPIHERGGLWRAGAMLLSCYVVLGLGVLAIIATPWGYLRLESAALPLGLALSALPSAMLIVYAATHGPTPREGSVLAGADRAEHALALLGALVLLPWYATPRPADVAWPIAAMALPAVAVGLHAVTLRRRATMIDHAFASASPCDAREPGSIDCDVGVGLEWRALVLGSAPAYRVAARTSLARCHGCPREGARAARRVACWSLLVTSSAVAHALILRAVD